MRARSSAVRTPPWVLSWFVRERIRGSLLSWNRVSTRRANRSCWCGAGELAPFGAGYVVCAACETLVRLASPGARLDVVRDEDRDFYGRRYWFERQRELGLPDLAERCGEDLRGRCLHWLAALLRYKRPPGRALELGSAHGAFVALLGWSGFRATGLELSPWVAAWARERFGVEMLAGPLEQQDLAPGSLDLVAAFDVLEHLEDPLGTVQRVANLLRDDGVVVLQTPMRPAAMDIDELERSGHRFREMLIDEHLHLFSERGVRELLARAGLVHVAFEPAFFDHYDMFLLASKRPLVRAESLDEAMPANFFRTPAWALLQCHEALRGADRGDHAASDLASRLASAVAAQTEAERQVEELTELYRVADQDRVGRLGQVEELTRLYRDSEADRAARLRQIEELTALYRTADPDRVERLRQVEEVTELYRIADRDRVERLRQIDELTELYRCADEDRTARQRQIDELTSCYLAADDERQALRKRLEKQAAETVPLEEAVRLQRELDELAAQLRASATRRVEAEASFDRERKESRARKQDLALALFAEESTRRAIGAREEGLRHFLKELRSRRVYRLLVRSGRWRELDAAFAGLIRASEPVVAEDPPTAQSLRAASTPAAVAHLPESGTLVGVDLTALLPGGINGGAKLVALEIVRGLARLAPHWHFVLLTSPSCHDELVELERENVSRLLVPPESTALSDLIDARPLKVLLCPMTAPPFFDPRVPLVSVIHDLQYLKYPQFFTDAERAERNVSFYRAARRAAHLIAVSEYVRGTVIREAGVEPERITAIHNGFTSRFREVNEDALYATLDRFGLRREGYFFYPANCWEHKNHAMLLAAYSRYRTRRPDSRIALALTGAELPDPAPILEAARRMGLASWVRWLGFVSDEDLAALFKGCRATIFPSLYEGFGMPIVEAMALGRPVACSNVTSMPEVTDGAALLFDPHRPAEVAEAMERLTADGELVESLIERGTERVERIGGLERTARRYLEVLESVLSAPRRYDNALAGIHSDGWTGRRVVISFRPPWSHLQLGFRNPRADAVGVRVNGRVEAVPAGGSCSLDVALGPGPDVCEVFVGPVFRPSEIGESEDSRVLGLLLHSATLHHDDTTLDLITERY
jgi:glycosyltransferase involved in cell wall biosynthesis/SAM-dependent methyltransferase